MCARNHKLHQTLFIQNTELDKGSRTTFSFPCPRLSPLPVHECGQIGKGLHEIRIKAINQKCPECKDLQVTRDMKPYNPEDLDLKHRRHESIKTR